MQFNLIFAMKSDLHPTYQDTKVTCTSCGTEFMTRSVRTEITVEVCSNCHPFYTGKRTLVDTAGRVEKFRMKMQKKEELGKPGKKAEVKNDDKSEQAEK